MLRARESARVRRANALKAALAADTAIGGVVVVQEDLLQGRLAARERQHRMIRKHRDHGSHAATDLDAKRVCAGAGHMHSLDTVEARSGTVEGDLDRLRAEVAQLRQRALVDQSPAAQDPNAVAQRLDLAEDVRGQEDRLPAFLGLRHRLAKRDLHQRISYTHLTLPTI